MGVKGTILYIGGFELPDKNAAAQRVIANAQILKSLGYDTVFVGICHDSINNKKILDTKSMLDEYYIYTVEYPNSIRRWAEYLTSAAPYIEVAETINNLKAIICYNFQSVALRGIRNYCFQNNILCVADVTEWYSGVGRSIPVKILKGMDTFYRMRVLHKDLDGLIVISKYLENYYSSCKCVVYIPPLNSLQGREKPCLNTDGVLKLVYAGSPGLKDRIDLLIEALPLVQRNVTLDVIGINKEEYIKIHPEHKNFRFGSNVVFHGRLSHEDTIKYIQQSHYSCFFRFQDRVTLAGFPTKFSEAVSLGTPVITNESSNIFDYIKDGENGFVVRNLIPKEIACVIDSVPAEIKVDRSLFSYENYRTVFQKLLSGLNL